MGPTLSSKIKLECFWGLKAQGINENRAEFKPPYFIVSEHCFHVCMSHFNKVKFTRNEKLSYVKNYILFNKKLYPVFQKQDWSDDEMWKDSSLWSAPLGMVVSLAQARWVLLPRRVSFALRLIHGIREEEKEIVVRGYNILSMKGEVSQKVVNIEASVRE